MAFTTQHVTEIDAAIASGVLTVRHRDGTSATYQDLDSMIKARRLMLAEIEAAAGTTRRRRTFRLYQSGNGF